MTLSESVEQRGYFMKHLMAIILVVISIIPLPGCGGRIFDWAKEHFEQGCHVDRNLEQARCFIKTERIYNQFTVVGGFSVLWLSDEVRKEYVELSTSFKMKTDGEKKAMLQRQIAENDHFIQFYVLSANAITIEKNLSDWFVVLHVDDRVYSPYEVKEIELPHEYLLIFGKLWNGFQTPYLISFAAKTVDGNPIVSKTTSCISLEFRSSIKTFCMNWPISYTSCCCAQ